MKNTTPRQGRKLLLGIWILIAAFAAIVIFTIGGFAFAASQETHDPFCASCHSQPESTFVQRSTSAPAVDLASYHTTQNTRCIDCHSGQGLTGRLQAELLGARNAFKWYTGTAVQPAVNNYPLTDAHCLKCHQDVTQQRFVPKESITIPTVNSGRGEREGRNNHWHAFMTRWQAADPNAGTCVSCHSGHATDSNPATTGTAQNGFMNAQNVQATCDACHRAIRREE